MSDLISRQVAIDAVMELVEAWYEWRSGVSRKISLLNAVYCALEDIPSAQPTVDAVPVIRCRDCKYAKRIYIKSLPWTKQWEYSCQYFNTHSVLGNGYCNNAERKEK